MGVQQWTSEEAGANRRRHLHAGTKDHPSCEAAEQGGVECAAGIR